MFKNVRFTYSVVSFNTALILIACATHDAAIEWKKKKRVLSPRRQRQVQVMVKVSGLTCRSVGLAKGENCTGVWRADRGSKLGGGCEMEVLLVGTNFQRERLFSKCQSFSADGWYHLRNGCSKTSGALTAPILQMPLQYISFPCIFYVHSCFSWVTFLSNPMLKSS